jgi:hypothetical protein
VVLYPDALPSLDHRFLARDHRQCNIMHYKPGKAARISVTGWLVASGSVKYCRHPEVEAPVPPAPRLLPGPPYFAVKQAGHQEVLLLEDAGPRML